MSNRRRFEGFAAAGLLTSRLAALALTATLAGCGGQDVELNGKIFDALGVSQATKKSSGDPKVAARHGLIMPPSTGSLPEPGAGRSPEADADLSFINDPDRKRTFDKSDLERRQAEYCKTNYEQPKLRGDQSAENAVGPAGPCRASILTSLKKWNGGDAAEDDKDEN